MPDPDLISAAVFNNAVWCDAVCQALGCDTDFVDDLWINSGTSPPFYPNAISLSRDGSDAQFAADRPRWSRPACPAAGPRRTRSARSTWPSSASACSSRPSGSA